MLYEFYIDLDTRIPLADGKSAKKGERIGSVLVMSVAHISKHQLHHIVPDISVRTIGSVLSRLLSEGKIEKVGSFKDAVCVLE